MSYSVMSEMHKIDFDFVSQVKRLENYPDFEKLAHVIQHGIQGFIVVKSI